MELTPEERQKIYAEEKARLEVRQELQNQVKIDFRMWRLLLGVIGSALLVLSTFLPVAMTALGEPLTPYQHGGWLGIALLLLSIVSFVLIIIDKYWLCVTITAITAIGSSARVFIAVTSTTFQPDWGLGVLCLGTLMICLTIWQRLGTGIKQSIATWPSEPLGIKLMRWLTFVLFSIALVLLVVAPVLALLTGIDILRPMLLQYSEVAFVVAVPILLGYLVNHMVLNIIVKRFVIGVALVTTASLIIIGFSVIVGLPSYIGQIKVYETVTLQDYMKIIWHFVLELAPY